MQTVTADIQKRPWRPEQRALAPRAEPLIDDTGGDQRNERAEKHHVSIVTR
jgi:hypothetical protein